MTKLQKGLTILSCACISLLLLFYRNPKKPITLHLGLYVGSSFDVYDDNSYAYVDKAIELFEEKHPNVTIKYESGIRKSDYSSWLSKQLLEGNNLDAYMVLDSDFNVLSSIGAMENLNDYISDSLIEKMYPLVLKQGTYENKLFALPYEVSPMMMMCVNQDLLEKEEIEIPDDGWTMDEFYKICEQITKDIDGDGDVDQYGCYNFTWDKILYCHGLSLFSEDGLSVNITDEVKRALKLAEKLDDLNRNYHVTSEDFDSGKVAFCPMSIAEYRTYQPYPYRVSNYSNFSWKCLTMPATSANTNNTTSVCSMMAIHPGSQNKKLAYEFIASLAGNEELQSEVIKMGKGVSVLRDVINAKDTQSVLQEEGLAISSKQLDYVLDHLMEYPKIKKYNEAKDQADYLIRKSFESGSLDTDLERIQKQLNTLLK
ncbi:MAG: extracellular solute-binding protein [Bacillota bacterium]|nr:extracellular solute-binding protein [Bacillota bacterium]